MFEDALSDARASGRRLKVAEIVTALQDDGLLSADNAQMTINFTNQKELASCGALWVVAAKNWRNEKAPNSRLDQRFLSQWLAQKTHLPFWNIDPLKTDVATVTKVISQKYARRHNILPVAVDDDSITVATTEPFERAWTHEISRISNKSIHFVIASFTDISRYIDEFYNLSRSVQGAELRHQSTPQSNVQNFEQLMELGRKGEVDANDQHIISIVDWLLQYAFEQRASDIHLEPRRDSGNVRFRIDGILHHVYEMPPVIMNAVSSRLKILGRMDVAEKRRPQDGRLKTKMPDSAQEIELRLSSMPTAFGEKLVMRIFDPTVLVRSFAELGFPPAEAGKFQHMISRPHGIILVTGPTGSGKTTTLYSSLRQLATEEVNVCTIEDPIELIEPAFNQMQVQHKLGVDFAAGVRTLLRQDPDIIMLGEIRDLESAQMAVQASLTGHLVLSTLHTNDAPSALTRLAELGVPSYLTAATLLGVLAQRLVRTLCPHCKAVDDDFDIGSWQVLTKPWNIAVPKVAYKAVGCDRCRQTGFLGRVGLYEMLLLDDNLRALIQKDRADLQQLKQAALKTGMLPLAIAGAQKVKLGQTTVAEVLKVAPPVGTLS